MDRDKIGLRVISLGGGVQSTAMLLMALEDKFTPPPDVAIFADTGWEPDSVYDNVEKTMAKAADHGFPVIKVQDKNLREDMQKDTDFPPIPLFSKSGGMLRRQCTREYKIQPIVEMVREICGVQTGRWMPCNVEMWIGISYEEIERMKDSPIQWQQNRYPLIEEKITRQDCKDYLRSIGWGVPEKSSCIICPYHDNNYWERMKQDRPDDWKEAVEFDKKIRNEALDDEECFIHHSRKPLDEALEDDSPSTNFCGGYCFT